MKNDVTCFHKKIHLVVEIAVGVLGPLGDMASDADLRKALEDSLNDSSDGRQNFSTEVLKDGLERSITSGLHKAICDDSCRRFPNKTTLDGASFCCKLSDLRLSRLYEVRVFPVIEVVSVRTTNEVPK